MSANLIAVNVGNTRTQLGAFEAGKLVDHAAVVHSSAESSSELEAAARRLFEAVGSDADVYLASVNDPVATTVARTLTAALGCDIQRIDADVPIPIGRKLDPGAFVGEDRLLAAAAAYDKLKAAVAIVDVGTAVTVDFVDGDGTFHGGAILPGARMMLGALHEHTAQLPLVDLAEPAEPIGHNTAQAILTGVVNGLRGAIRELIEKYAEIYQAYPHVIATGGDATMLLERYDLIESIAPQLILEGMAVAHRHAIAESES